MAAPGRSPSSPGFQAIASQDSAIARRDGRSGLLNPRSLSAPRAVSVTSGTITTCSAAGRPRGRTAFERGKAVTAALSAPGRSAPASEPACQPGFRRPFEHVKGNRAPGRSTGAASWGGVTASRIRGRADPAGDGETAGAPVRSVPGRRLPSASGSGAGWVAQGPPGIYAALSSWRCWTGAGFGWASGRAARLLNGVRGDPGRDRSCNAWRVYAPGGGSGYAMGPRGPSAGCFT
jgi:hypothetical protein